MNHEEAKIAFSRRLDEDLPNDEDKALEGHLSSCPDCRREAERLRSSVFDSPTYVTRTPAGLYDKIMSGIEPKPVSAPRPGPPVAAAVFAVLAAAGLAAIYHINKPAPRPTDSPVAVKKPPQKKAVPKQAKPDARKALAARLAGRSIGAERILRTLPPSPAGLRITLRGSTPPPDESPSLRQALHKEGLKDIARSNPIMELLEKRHGRLERIAKLKRDAKIGEGRDGLLSRAFPENQSASPKDLELIEIENKDRTELYRLYAGIVSTTETLSRSQILEEVRRGFASAQRTLAEPGEWLQKDDGRWYRVVEE